MFFLQPGMSEPIELHITSVPVKRKELRVTLTVARLLVHARAVCVNDVTGDAEQSQTDRGGEDQDGAEGEGEGGEREGEREGREGAVQGQLHQRDRRDPDSR